MDAPVKRIFIITLIIIRQIILGLLISVLLLALPAAGLKLLNEIYPNSMVAILTAGPTTWLDGLFMLFNVLWFPAFLAVWIFRHSARLQKMGVKNKPAVWSAGIVLPMVFYAIVFVSPSSLLQLLKPIIVTPFVFYIPLFIAMLTIPAYLVFRSVIWPRNVVQPAEPVVINEFHRRVSRVLSIVIIVGIAIYLVSLLIGSLGKFSKADTETQVAKIHATRLMLDDVLGVNLPPDPGVEADKTIQGIDANKNGIRDDVELAIFKAYPNSAKTRAVLLQYALALQTEFNQPSVNTEIVIAAVQEEDRAYICVGDILSREDSDKYFREVDVLRAFVKNLQLNTPERKSLRTSFYKQIGSYNSLDRKCDIDYSRLPD